MRDMAIGDREALQIRLNVDGISKNDRPARDEVGAVLILAMAYIVTVSLIVMTLSSWATNDLHNTTSFNSTSSLHTAAGSVTNTAIESIRYATLLSNGQAQNVATPLSYCWQPTSGFVSQLTIDQATVAVWCTSVENLNSAATRVVTFYACQSTLTSSSSSSVVAAAGAACSQPNASILTAVVTYDDYPPGSSPALTQQCSLYCGEGATLTSWVWK